MSNSGYAARRWRRKPPEHRVQGAGLVYFENAQGVVADIVDETVSVPSNRKHPSSAFASAIERTLDPQARQ